eukprot:NODE_6821_length_619_cov_159.768293_g6798_i0.p1 GENE.NODE_6821_length_619_cov_159.768293_g6798_i0~~NODE_6821_length_619_cov_159.768293_g6798_i0.p1  ORF type:complete len:155 (+),score=25.28 NODE_6821_length_619_cov_159.768293_g6798_i0:109-573(+)
MDSDNAFEYKIFIQRKKKRPAQLAEPSASADDVKPTPPTTWQSMVSELRVFPPCDDCSTSDGTVGATDCESDTDSIARKGEECSRETAGNRQPATKLSADMDSEKIVPPHLRSLVNSDVTFGAPATGYGANTVIAPENSSLNHKATAFVPSWLR